MSAFETPRPIATTDSCGDFDCGEPTLNDWLVNRALRNERSGASRAIVSIHRATGSLAGYYCLSASGIDAESAPSRLKRNMPSIVPVVLLGRLAVDLRFQGMGVGTSLLQDALARSVQAASTIGARAVVVHPVNQAATNFYRRFDFAETSSVSEAPMYALIRDIKAALSTLTKST